VTRLDRETLRRSSWHSLLAEGAVQRLLVSRGEAAKLLGTVDKEPDKPFIDLWLALATPPPIGESLLGQRIYESELAKIGPDDDLILIGATGLYSFKGTEWRRSDAFDRIELIQGGRTIRLKPADHTQVEALRAAGAPELRESALFRVARASGFVSTKPFRLDLDLGTPAAAAAGPAVVSLEYRIPDRYLIAPAVAPATALPHKAGQSAASAPGQTPLWQDICGPAATKSRCSPCAPRRHPDLPGR
jgi:transcriptional regulator of nitric oxide reductase